MDLCLPLVFFWDSGGHWTWIIWSRWSVDLGWLLAHSSELDWSTNWYTAGCWDRTWEGEGIYYFH